MSLIRKVPAGSGDVVAVGETIYRVFNAVLTLQKPGLKISLVNKLTLNSNDKALRQVVEGMGGSVR